jgi:hypothetical protein
VLAYDAFVSQRVAQLSNVPLVNVPVSAQMPRLQDFDDGYLAFSLAKEEFGKNLSEMIMDKDASVTAIFRPAMPYVRHAARKF